MKKKNISHNATQWINKSGKSEYKNTFFLANRDKCEQAKGAMWVSGIFTKTDKQIQQGVRFMKCVLHGALPVIKFETQSAHGLSNTGVEEKIRHETLFSLCQMAWATIALIFHVLET